MASSTWIVSITERYGDLETVTHHPVRAASWAEAMEAGRAICAFGMRSDWVQRESENMWSYLRFGEAATVTNAVEVMTLDDVVAAMGGYAQQAPQLPPVGRPYDLENDPASLIRVTYRD